MTNAETYIFVRLFQSYVTGGDTYSFVYKTANPDKIKQYQDAIKSLEDNGFIQILYQSDKKTRMALTEKGIDHGSSVIFD